MIANPHDLWWLSANPDDGVKYHRFKHWSLTNATHHLSTLGHWTINWNSLSVTIQPIPHPASGPSIKSIFLQFGNQDVMWDSVKCFAQVQVNDVSCSSFVHWCCNSIIKVHQVCQAWLALGKVMLVTTNHLISIFHVH